jgi:hypothetical protein
VENRLSVDAFVRRSRSPCASVAPSHGAIKTPTGGSRTANWITPPDVTKNRGICAVDRSAFFATRRLRYGCECLRSTSSTLSCFIFRAQAVGVAHGSASFLSGSAPRASRSSTKWTRPQRHAQPRGVLFRSSSRISSRAPRSRSISAYGTCSARPRAMMVCSVVRLDAPRFGSLRSAS